MASIFTTSNGITLVYNGRRYYKNPTTQEKNHWRCSLRSCRSPLQSNIFSNDQDVRVLSVRTRNQNTASYTKNDFKEFKYTNESAHKSSDHEKRVCDFVHEKIGAKPYDCIDSARSRSSSNIETVKICKYHEMNNYDKINLYCNTFNKYMKCMKEIEPPFLSSVLKDIESKIDICSILNEKENVLKNRRLSLNRSSIMSQQSLRKVNEREMKRHKLNNV